MLEDLKEIEQQLREKLRPQKASYTGPLYHYCSAEALKGILSNKSMWFSDTRFMNDMSEKNYIYHFLKEILQSNPSKLNKWFLDFLHMVFANNGNDIYGNFSNAIKDQTYIACFSINPDNFALWNYYTKSRNSIGYNIEFSLNPFSRSIDNTTFINGAVIYDENTQYELIKKIILAYNEYSKDNKTLQFYNPRSLVNKHNTSIYDNFYFSFLSIFNLFNLFFKPETYAVEQEYRFAIFNTDNIQLETRIHNGFFIPYSAEKIRMDQIHSIMISPCNEPELYANGIRALWQEQLLKDQENKTDNPMPNQMGIGVSAIPKRY